MGSHRRISGPDDPNNPSLEDQVTAGVNFVIYQQEAEIRASFVRKFRPRWIAEWANRKKMAIPAVVGF